MQNGAAFGAKFELIYHQNSLLWEVFACCLLNKQYLFVSKAAKVSCKQKLYDWVLMHTVQILSGQHSRTKRLVENTELGMYLKN